MNYKNQYRIIVEENGSQQVFHLRDLGNKAGNIYPQKEWSDVVIHNVSVDKTSELENHDEFLHILNEASNYRDPIYSELNQKNIPQEILVSESIIPGNSEKKIFRKRTKTRQKKGITELKRYRTIPPKKKKYPTKPRKKGDDQIIKINKENDYVHWEINSRLQEPGVDSVSYVY